MDAVDPGALGAGGGAAAGIAAAGPGVAHELRGRRDRAVRSVVPADHAAGGARAVRKPTRLPVLTTVHGLFAVAFGGVDPVAAGRGPVRGLVAAHRGV